MQVNKYNNISFSIDLNDLFYFNIFYDLIIIISFSLNS